MRMEPLLCPGAAIRRLEEKVMGTHDREAAGIVPDRLQRQRSRVRVQCQRVDDRGIDAALVHQPDRLGRSKMRHRPMRLEVERVGGSGRLKLRLTQIVSVL